MAYTIKKSRLVKEDVYFDSAGTGNTRSVPTSSGGTRTGTDINASHLPVTTTVRGKTGISGTDVDALLQEVVDRSTYLDYKLSAYASLSAALTAIGNTTGARLTLDVDGDIAGAAVEITANIVLRALPNRTLKDSVGGGTLTVSGEIQAGRWQVFASTVTPVGNAVNTVYNPEWFGTGTGAVNRAITFLNQRSGGGTVFLHAGDSYFLSASIATDSDVTIASNGGYIDGAYTLTINGGIEAGLFRIFNIANVTVAGSPKVDAVYPQWFGAVGDGVTDDTAAIQAAVVFFNTSDAPRLELKGTFLVDFDALTNDRLSITKSDCVVCGGGTIKAKTGSYGAGVANGDTKYYNCFYITGSRVSVRDVTIDGNDQFSQYGYSGALPNYWFSGVYLEGESSLAKAAGNIVENVRYINGGGWAVKGVYQDGSTVTGVYAEHSQGIGFDSSNGCSIVGCNSRDGHDAHYAAWNSDGVTIVGNTADSNDNGSGVDVSGSVNVTVASNIIRNCQDRGIFVLQDPNIASNQPKNISIIGNSLFNNNAAVVSEKGDIHIGAGDVTADTRGAGTLDVDGCIISGNSILSTNGANCITLGQYATNVSIVGNVFKDEAASAATRAVIVYNATNIHIEGNSDLIEARQGTGASIKAIGSGPVYFDGGDSQIDDSASSLALATKQLNFVQSTTKRANALKTYQVEGRYGRYAMSASLTVATAGTNVCDVSFNAGGFEVADIEVCVTAGGNQGVRRQYAAYQGYVGGGAPGVVVAAADYYSGGAAVPTITFTTSTENVRISVTATGGADVSGTVEVIVNGGPNVLLTPLL